jgi:hypothetical protein
MWDLFHSACSKAIKHFFHDTNQVHSASNMFSETIYEGGDGQVHTVLLQPIINQDGSCGKVGLLFQEDRHWTTHIIDQKEARGK